MTATNGDRGFKFSCPHCSQSLEATMDLIGKSFDCPMCGKGFVVSSPKIERIRNAPACSRNLIVTALGTAILTSAFWWMTPFIARAKGKQATEGALSALREGFGSSGDSEWDRNKKLEKEKMESIVKSKISLKFDGNQRVTVTNNSDFEIEDLSFEYTNAENLTVATGYGRFSGKALKSGQTATVDISSKETIQPKFKVRPSYAQFSSQMDMVRFPD